MSKNKYIFLTNNSLYKSAFENLQHVIQAEWLFIDDNRDLVEKIKLFDPKYIFVPHWSQKIPSDIFSNYCVVIFHMTDLPYGRGGTPLQNLIVRGFKETKISALKCTEGIDCGPIFLKKDLSLEGTAAEIFSRMVIVVESMVKEIITDNPKPKKQIGDVHQFKRRTLDDCNISELDDMETLYDYIRLLDSEYYPSAFLEHNKLRLEFSDAQMQEGFIEAKVRIYADKK